ncbi:MAG TPA: tetratricopeptide repeat protein [Anaerolineae bacterium]|nr:tetratricopeptide repeat protein [Anaerolineae bacterium]
MLKKMIENFGIGTFSDDSPRKREFLVIRILLVVILPFIIWSIHGSILTTACHGAVEPDSADMSHLTKAIALYNEGRYDEAFDELTAQVNMNRFCALAYYYRARIRVIKKNYSLALKSLTAAFRDSSDFTDAIGLHAYILKEMGNTEEALSEWRRFVAAVGSTGDEVSATESIVLPELYREKLDQLWKAQLETREIEFQRPADQREEISNKKRQFQMNVDQQPIPVTDLIKKQSSSDLAKGIQEREGIFSYPVWIALIFFILVIFTIVYIYLRFMRSSKKNLVVSEIDTILEQSVSVTPQHEGIVPLDMESEQFESSINLAFTHAMKLRNERKRHQQEIERLLSKI